MRATGQIVACCPYCGSPQHHGKCPLVKALEYHPDGKLKRVEFFAPADYRPVTVGVIPGLPDTRPIGGSVSGELADWGLPANRSPTP